MYVESGVEMIDGFRNIEKILYYKVYVKRVVLFFFFGVVLEFILY